MFPLSTIHIMHTYFITLGSCRKKQEGTDCFQRPKKVFVYPINRYLNFMCSFLLKTVRGVRCLRNGSRLSESFS